VTAVLQSMDRKPADAVPVDTVLPDRVAATLTAFREAAAEDLLLLALLHDRELTRKQISSLREHCYDDFLGLNLRGERARQALNLLRQGLTDLPTELTDASLDALAVDYAEIYLTYGLRASPCESVWLDEDNLALQSPMFRVRAWYRRYGLAVEDWRKRSDDHLVYELRFLAQLLRGDPEPAALAEVAQFLDEHPLRWIDRFAERVCTRCATRFYAGLALLTAAYLDELRDLLAALIGQPRPAAPADMPPPDADADAPYVPGTSPGW
jgi:TorA maturation chaperone TorD